MKQAVLLVGLAAAVGVCAQSRAADVRIEREAVVDPQQIRRLVDVVDVQHHDDEVTGTVVNRSVNPIREVKLAIQYMWLWRNEMRPGTDDPGRTDFHLIPEDIPPGGRVRFTYRPRELLPRRSDGRFEVSATVMGLVEVSPQGGPRIEPLPQGGTRVEPPRQGRPQ